jgi:solute carrier family 25 (mitochondrial aspartate/glutamate transporter), member 12/13
MMFQPCLSTRLLLVALVALGLSDDVVALVPPALVHTAVGAIAGSTGAIAAYPIDYVKSQLQTEEGRLKYKGGFDAAKDIIATSGPFALYKGLWVNVVGIAPEKTIKLSVNSIMRGLLSHHGIAGEIAAGAIAGCTQVIVTNPLEVVKLKLQTSKMTVKEVLSQMQSLGDLYQGAEACLARDMVFSAILFPLYAHLKVALLALFVGGMGVSAGSASFWADLLAGSFAAGPAALISTPADVVKTRLQQARDAGEGSEEAILLGRTQIESFQQPKVQVSFASSDRMALVQEVEAKDKSSFFALMGSIASEEGPEVLFSGWFERIVRSVPQFGVTLATFDLLNNYAVNHGWLLEQAAH